MKNKEISVIEVEIQWNDGDKERVVVTPKRNSLAWEERVAQTLREAQHAGAIKNFKVRYGVMPVPIIYEEFEDWFRRTTGL